MPDYFELLGLKRQFHPPLGHLEAAYHAAARLCHPDQKMGQGEDIRALAQLQMSALNEAYQTLRDPNRLREYLLKLENISASSVPPSAWSEEWFELEDERDLNVSIRWQEFSDRLLAQIEQLSQRIFAQEQLYNSTQDVHCLETLGALNLEENYCRSLLRAVNQRMAHA